MRRLKYLGLEWSCRKSETRISRSSFFYIDRLGKGKRMDLSRKTWKEEEEEKERRREEEDEEEKKKKRKCKRNRKKKKKKAEAQRAKRTCKLNEEGNGT
uniref:Uncharacterized protein n=1 Tax=Vespula pensylvanica TaxID=30213 RepID=A0A834NQK7_VESPE|nr:hypothetical protein H0235_012250 [Vespula pensylvanica]